ncbi:MAG: hypothetical protein JST60_07970 [Chloroflexi bacterium SZAS-1]|jgi:hypothetical protein|nr:hypothetical protein [Chloroflexi bacterium SZAS-1]HNP87859.1 hypothetical protein [Kouleothrix sp.]
MSGKLISFYRLPTTSAVRLGQIRIVRDRNGVYYADGSKVVETTITGGHSVLTLADGRNFYVLTRELEGIPKARSTR